MTNSIVNPAPVAPTQETFNGIIVDMLRGVKNASGEIYAASKTMIVNAIDFAQNQTPLVVQEFLKWKMMEAIVWLIVGIISLLVISYISYRVFIFFRKVDNKPDYFGNVDYFGRIMTTFVSAFILPSVIFMCIIPNTLRIVKIKIAPRVYLIEYVSDLYNRKSSSTRHQ
jgi:hypothetical protein